MPKDMPKNVGFHCISVDFPRQPKNSGSTQPTVNSVFYSLVWTSVDKTLGIIWSAREDLNLRPPTPHDAARKTLRAALLLVKSTIRMYKQTVLF
jgi:hypothetical protein